MDKLRVSREEHVQALRGMLLERAPCDYCPARWAMRRRGIPYPGFYDGYDPECTMCRTVGRVPTSYNYGCPCHHIGPELALKNAALVVEEWEEERRILLSRKF